MFLVLNVLQLGAGIYKHKTVMTMKTITYLSIPVSMVSGLIPSNSESSLLAAKIALFFFLPQVEREDPDTKQRVVVLSVVVVEETKNSLGFLVLGAETASASAVAVAVKITKRGKMNCNIVRLGED